MGIRLADMIALMEARPYRGRTGPEDNVAIEVANYLRAAVLERRLSATWTCIPHEVGAISMKSKDFKLAQGRYAKAKAMGLITGSADYVFVWQGGGGWIELKSATGSLSEAQRKFRDWCATTNSNHAVCRTLDEVVETLFSWKVLQR
jgi:hypothetical protein